MSPQSATAMQPVKGPAPVKQTSGMNIFARIEEMHNSIARRAFELFEGNGRWPGRELENWLRAESELLHPMRLELTESDTHFMVRAEVPGFNAKELEINVEPQRLTVTGKTRNKARNQEGKDSLFRDVRRKGFAGCGSSGRDRCLDRHGNFKRWHPERENDEDANS